MQISEQQRTSSINNRHHRTSQTAKPFRYEHAFSSIILLFIKTSLNNLNDNGGIDRQYYNY